MTHPDPRYRREWAPDALKALNLYRHRGGRQPLLSDNQVAVTDEEWKAMSADAKAALWRKHGIGE